MCACENKVFQSVRRRQIYSPVAKTVSVCFLWEGPVMVRVRDFRTRLCTLNWRHWRHLNTVLLGIFGASNCVVMGQPAILRKEETF